MEFELRIGQLVATEDFLAAIPCNEQKKMIELRIRKLRVCGCCGIARPGSTAAKAVQEEWYNNGRRCGYCGKDSATTEKVAFRSMQSRLLSELAKGNDLLKEKK